MNNNLPPDIAAFVERCEKANTPIEVTDYQQYENIYEINYKNSRGIERKVYLRKTTNLMSDTNAKI